MHSAVVAVVVCRLTRYCIHLQSLSSLGEQGHTLCRRIKLSNKSLSEEAARVVAGALRTMEQVGGGGRGLSARRSIDCLNGRFDRWPTTDYNTSMPCLSVVMVVRWSTQTSRTSSRAATSSRRSRCVSVGWVGLVWYALG